MRLTPCAATIALLSSAALTATAQAQGLEFQFSGYGTLAATYADTTNAQFRSSWQQSRGSRGRVDWGVDSRIGVQLDTTVNETFSATGQLLVQRLGSKERLAVEWLYGQAQLGPDTALRAGRVVLTAFMLSDVRNVGYSQHWAHTPYEVYLTFPPVDGAQLLYRSTWEGIKLSVQPTFGRAEAEFYYQRGPAGLVPAHTAFHKLFALNLTAERGNWIARLGHTVADATIEWSIAAPEPLKYTFTSVGLQYDNGKLLAMAEMMTGKTDSQRYDISGQYLTAGYRLGAWMPYASSSYLRNRGTVIQTLPDSRTTALGMRWDAVKDVAIKAQTERARLSGQQFINLTPGTDLRRSATVYTLALDFVF